jgi:hypothetical protein
MTPALATLSLSTILSIWTDLEEARAGQHGYGGDTAEIYVYRLLVHRPAGVEHELSDYQIARRALYQLLEMFKEVHDVAIWLGCTRSDDGVLLGPGMLEVDQRHRWHVRIRPH